MIDPRSYLESQIKQALRRWRRGLLFRGMALLVAILAAGSLVLLALRPFWVSHPWLIIGGGLLMLLLSVWVIIRYLIRPLRQRISPARVARSIEQRHPELEDRLATAVDVSSRQRAEQNFWLSRVIQDAVSHISGFDLPKQVQIRGYYFWQTVLILAVFALLSGFLLQRDWQKDLKQVIDNRFVAPRPVAELEVMPGDIKLKKGESLQVRAVVRHFEPEEVRLFYSYSDSTWMSEAMEPEIATSDYQAQLFDVEQPLRYYVKAGDEISNIYTVQVYEAPEIKRIDLTYKYPPDTGLPDKHERDGGDIWAPVGTRVKLRVVSTWPIIRAELFVGEGAARPMNILNDTTAAAELQVKKDGYYRIRLVSKEGLDNAPLADYFIHAVQNQAPILTLLYPGRDYKATMLEEVPVVVEVSDDFGLKKVELFYTVNSGKENSIPLFPEQQKQEKTAELTLKTRTYRGLLYLEDLKVKPGDFLSYYVKADDPLAGGPVTTDLFFIEIRHFENIYRIATSQGQGGAGGRQFNLSQLQKEIIVATNKLIQGKRGYGRDQYRENVDNLHKSQQNLRENVERISRTLKLRMNFVREEGRELLKYLDAAAEAMLRAEPLIKKDSLQAALTPEREAYHQLLKADALNRERELSAGPSQGVGAPVNTDELTRLFHDEMDKLKSKYETLQQGDRQQRQAQIDEALRKIQELARRQQRLNDLSRQLAQKNMSEEERRREIKKLQRQQEQLNRDLQRTMTQMTNMMRNQQMADNETLRRMQQANQALNQTMDRLRRRDLQNAANSGRQALNQLREIEDRLKKARQNAIKDEIRDIREKFRQLASSQAGLREQTQKLQQSRPDSGTVRRQQKEQQRIRQQTEQAMRQLAELSRKTGNDPELQRDLQAIFRDLRRSAATEMMRQSEQALRSGKLKQAERLQRRAEAALNRGAEKLAHTLSKQDQSPEQKLELALDQTQQLRQRIEQELRQSQKEQQRPGQVQQGKRQDRRQRQGGGQPGNPPTGPEKLTAEHLQRWRELLWQARKQLNELQNQIAGVDTSLARQSRQIADQINNLVVTFRGGDPSRLETIRNQIADPLRRLEAELATQLQLIKGRESLRTVLEDQAPAKYKEFIEAYYRSLSKEK